MENDHPKESTVNSMTTSHSPPREEVPGENRRLLALHALQPSRGTGKKDKNGRAKVRDPPGQKQDGCGGLRVQWIGQPAAHMEIVADMIEGHDHNHQAPQDIQGIYARSNLKRLQPNWITYPRYTKSDASSASSAAVSARDS